MIKVWNHIITHPSFNRYFSGAAYMYVGQVISGIATLMVGIAMANLVDKNVYGSYKYILATIGLIGTFGLTGMRVAVMRSAARGYKHSLVTATKQYLRYLPISIAILFSVGIYYILKENYVFGLLFIVGGAIFSFSDSVQFYTIYLNGIKDFRKSTIYNSLGIGIQSMALVACAILYPSVLSLVFTYLIISGLVSYVLHRKVRGDLGETVQDEKSDLEMQSHAKHQSLANLFSGIVSQVDKLIVFQFVGAIQLASYAFALAIPEFLRTFVKLVSSLFFPAISSNNNPKTLKKIMLSTFAISLGIASIIFIAYFFSADYIFNILFPKYTESITPSIIYSLSLFVLAVQSPFTSYFSARMKNKLMHTNNFFTSVIQLLVLLLAAIFTPSIIGIIWARVIGQSLSALYTTISMYKRYRSS